MAEMYVRKDPKHGKYLRYRAREACAFCKIKLLVKERHYMIVDDHQVLTCHPCNEIIQRNRPMNGERVDIVVVHIFQGRYQVITRVDMPEETIWVRRFASDSITPNSQDILRLHQERCNATIEHHVDFLSIGTLPRRYEGRVL